VRTLIDAQNSINYLASAGRELVFGKLFAKLGRLNDKKSLYSLNAVVDALLALSSGGKLM
jgi:hypothetical protein